MFDRATQHIYLIDKHGNPAGAFPAANNPVPGYYYYPEGSFDFDQWINHTKPDEQVSFGKHGNFVFDVPGHSGMGVHAGRRGPQSKTHGCIRTTDAATGAMKRLHAVDPIEKITVVGPPQCGCEKAQ